MKSFITVDRDAKICNTADGGSFQINIVWKNKEVFMRKVFLCIISLTATLILCVTANAATRTPGQIVRDKSFQNALLSRIQQYIVSADSSHYTLDNYFLSFGDAWTDGKTTFLDFTVGVDMTPPPSQWNNSPEGNYLFSIAIDGYLNGGDLSTVKDSNIYFSMSASDIIQLSPFPDANAGQGMTFKVANITKLDSFGIAPPNIRHYIEKTGGGYQVSYDDLKFPDPNMPKFNYGSDYKPLFINGYLMQSDVKTVNDRTLVPIRAIVEGLGGNISWDDKTRKVTINKDGVVIEMTIGSTTVKVNGQTKATDVAPNIYNDYTYLPVRFVSENLGASVSWNTTADTMLVQQVQGNVFVDQYDPAMPYQPEDTAVKRVKAAMNQNFKFFKAANENKSLPGLDLPSIYQLIQKNIDNTKVVGEISRYYVIQSVRTFYYDKYSGTFFYPGSEGGGPTWVSMYLYGDFWVFTKGYFAD